MSFGKSKRDFEPANYNPPPGYYEGFTAKVDEDKPSNFMKEPRFKEAAKIATPGPGQYFSNKNVKKRLLEESKKKQDQFNFKINSIPSIPKHSHAGIYQQLAPGILVIHQVEEDNPAIGPGTYNPQYPAKKVEAHKFNPQHTKKFIELIPEGPAEAERQMMELKEAARQQRRRIQAKQLCKKSPAQSFLNPTDVCLELIILREKQMKDVEVPAPGQYYNEKVYSSFQNQTKPSDLQVLAGRAERFPKQQEQFVGPGKYEVLQEQNFKQGGFIGKAQRKGIANQSQQLPGPGAYIVNDPDKEPEIPKSRTKYPAIFGSGCNRFMSSTSKKQVSPGPGSYYIERTKRKIRPKSINLRNVDTMASSQHNQMKATSNNLMISPQNVDVERVAIDRVRKTANHNTSSFCSSLRRFNDLKPSQLGPGTYETVQQITNKTFNKRSSLLNGQSRFQYNQIEEKPGPGYYEVKEDLIRTKKTHNVRIT